MRSAISRQAYRAAKLLNDGESPGQCYSIILKAQNHTISLTNGFNGFPSNRKSIFVTGYLSKQPWASLLNTDKSKALQTASRLPTAMNVPLGNVRLRDFYRETRQLRQKEVKPLILTGLTEPQLKTSRLCSSDSIIREPRRSYRNIDII
jgi:hypothetical protein